MAPAGSPYYAIADGVVIWASDKREGTSIPSAYGWHVILKHGDVKTYYAHAMPNPPVQLGQQVTAGQVIAKSGNTGNSSGYHLHLTIKIPGHVEPGWGSSPEYADPLPLVLPVAPEGGTTGWVSSTYLTPATGGKAVVTTNLNIRSGPGTSYSKLGTLYFGAVVTILSTQAGWSRVKVHSYNMYDVPGGGGTFPVALGPHFSADSQFLPGEQAAAEAMKPDIMKFLSSHRADQIGWAANRFPGVPIVLRAFLDWGGRNISPQQFFDWTWSDVERSINACGNNPIILELPGNEQNLAPEGLFYSWTDGYTYASWALQVLSLYRQRTSLPVYYPGLSPGGSIGGLRQDHIQFFNQSMQFVMACQGLCIHTYYNPPAGYSMQSAVAVVDDYLARYPVRPVIISEFSWNANNTTPQAKAQSYLEFWNIMRSRNRIKGITPFVMSASNPQWSWASGTGEVFVENGQSVGIAEIIGSR